MKHYPGIATDSSTEANPVELSWPGNHEMALQRLQALLPPPARVLDIPTGYGAMLKRLTEAGYQAEGADLHPDLCRISGTTVRQQDLNGRLDYGDGCFDAVIFLEGIEHVETPFGAVRELARIVRPGGYLIVSTPNTLNIEERLKTLLRGFSPQFPPPSKEHLDTLRQHGNDVEGTFHIFPLSYRELRYMLEASGLALVEVNNPSPKRRIKRLKPLANLLRRLTRSMPAEERTRLWMDELESDAVLLGGNILQVIARRLPDRTTS